MNLDSSQYIFIIPVVHSCAILKDTVIWLVIIPGKKTPYYYCLKRDENA